MFATASPISPRCAASSDSRRRWRYARASTSTLPGCVVSSALGRSQVASKARDIPRLLLVTEIAPSDAHVGGIYLRDLCALYPAGALTVCVLAEEPIVWPESLRHVPYHLVRRPP